MSDEINQEDNYSIQINLPEKRMSAGISAEVKLKIIEAIGFNQLIYQVIQKPIDDETPIILPSGSYTLRLEASVLERSDADVVEEHVEEHTFDVVECEEHTPTALAADATGVLQELVDSAEQKTSPAVERSKGRGKGRKTVAPRTSGGSHVKPRRARR